MDEEPCTIEAIEYYLRRKKTIKNEAFKKEKQFDMGEEASKPENHGKQYNLAATLPENLVKVVANLNNLL